MKPAIATAIVLTLFSSGCNRPERSASPTATPDALQESSYARLSTSGRGYGDLVEELYRERVSVSKELQNLERTIDELQRQEEDSTRAYVKHNAKNQSYYGAAQHHVSQMNDSSLKRSVLAIIEKSQALYDSTTTEHRMLIAAIQAKTLRLSDIHTLVKISQTLPMIESFQRNNRPAEQPIKNHLGQVEKVILQAEKQVAR